MMEWIMFRNGRRSCMIGQCSGMCTTTPSKDSSLGFCMFLLCTFCSTFSMHVLIVRKTHLRFEESMSAKIDSFESCWKFFLIFERIWVIMRHLLKKLKRMNLSDSLTKSMKYSMAYSLCSLIWLRGMFWSARLSMSDEFLCKYLLILSFSGWITIAMRVLNDFRTTWSTSKIMMRSISTLVEDDMFSYDWLRSCSIACSCLKISTTK